MDLTTESLDALMDRIFDLEADGLDNNEALALRATMVREHGLSLELCLLDYKWIPLDEVIIGYVWVNGIVTMASPHSDGHWYAYDDNGVDTKVPTTILYLDHRCTVALKTIN